MKYIFWMLTVSAALVLNTGCDKDDPTDPPTVVVRGVIFDYFSDAVMFDAAVHVDGSPQLMALTDAIGIYQLENIPETDHLVLVASKSNYHSTSNIPAQANVNLIKDLLIASHTDIQRQYTSLGISPTPESSVVIAELEDGNDPRIGIPLADIQLVNTTQNSVGAGPFFFGDAGDIVQPAELSTSAEFNGKSRVAFLNVPAGDLMLRVRDGSTTLTAPVVTRSNGVTIVKI